MVMKLTGYTIVIGIALLVAAFLLIGSAGIATWEYSNSDQFCGQACHQVHPQEPFAHSVISQHSQVSCVECHIGRMGFLESAIEKAGHIKHAWSLIVGYDRPLYSTSLTSAEKSCVSCHPKDTAHHHNSIRTIKHYDQDAKNTEHKTSLIMRTMGRSFGKETRLDMNWHASGAVKYRIDDPQQRSIRWVEATLPDGSKREYQDVRNPLSEQELALTDNVKTMDCINCHNQAGHPFFNPESVIDMALSSGILSSKLPFVKKRMVDLVNKDFDTAEQAQELVDHAWTEYLAELEGISSKKSKKEAVEDLKQLQTPMLGLMVRSKHLEDEGIDWSSFPDHMGHRDTPGCFRCHNGRMQTDDNLVIPVNCTSCHSIPLVTTRGRIPPYYTEQIGMRKPRDHRDPAYMSKHMDQATESCDSCHGAINYGNDDKSHCSNSGCHSADWKNLDLDALRTPDAN